MSSRQSAAPSRTATASQRERELARLKAYDMVCVSAILEDCADQLAVLGGIMPGFYESGKSASEFVEEEIDALVAGQQELEDKYETVMARRSPGVKSGSPGVKSGGVRGHKGQQRSVNKREAGEAAKELKNSTHVFSRSIKQSPLTTDNLTKIQSDRKFVEEVVMSTLGELGQSSTYHALVEAVRQEKQRKLSLQQTIIKEEEGRKRIVVLSEQLKAVDKEKEQEIKSRNEMIAHLKDQLQEMKAKTGMEKKYVKKVAEVGVAQTQKKCSTAEKELNGEIKSLRTRIEEEGRAHEDILRYLGAHHEELVGKVDMWMERYEKEVDEQQRKLDVLKASKAKDLERLQELNKTYVEYEQVVVEDRIEKEKIRRKQDEEAIQLKAAIQLQAWWRGVLVRKGLGPFSKKKKKGKKGKSGKKKKK